MRQQFEIKRSKLADYFRNLIVKMNNSDTWDQGAGGLVPTTMERDYAQVLWDLLAHVQHSTLGPIFEHQISPRHLPSKEWPHVAPDKNGLLSVHEAGLEWADKPPTPEEAAWLADPTKPMPSSLKIAD